MEIQPPPAPPKTGGELILHLPGTPPVTEQELKTTTSRAISKSLSQGNEQTTLPKSSPPVLGGVGGGYPQINNRHYLKPYRKSLRKNLTSAEATFWKVVQNSKFEGRKFRRQHSVGNYILDFYCPLEKLAIELDGQVHFNDAAIEYDYERKLYLQSYGIKTLRFVNKLIFEELDFVLGVIKSNFGWNKLPPPAPPRTGGEL
jgi:very-short-patch-repair endonuclease